MYPIFNTFRYLFHIIISSVSTLSKLSLLFLLQKEKLLKVKYQHYRPAYYAHKEKKVEEINDHEEKQEGEIYSHQEAKGEGEGEESIVSLESFLVNHTTKQDEERHESFNDDINDESKNNEKISAW